MKLHGWLAMCLLSAPFVFGASITENFDGWSDGSYGTVSGYTNAEGQVFETYNSVCGSQNARSGNAVRFNDDSSANEYLLMTGTDGNGKDGGIGDITFWYRHWDGDGSTVEFVVQYDAGSGWNSIGSTVSVSSTTYAQYSQSPGLSGDNIKIRIVAVTDDERLTIDDLSITDFGAATPPSLAPIGNQSTTESNALVFAVTASPTESDTVTMSVSNNPAGTAFSTTNENGTFYWNNPTPTGVYAMTFYAWDDDGVDTETITVTVYEAISEKLIISEVADPADVYQARFIELYNAGATAIDFESQTWYVSRQVNGGTWSDYVLTGTVAAGATYVLANDSNDHYSAYGEWPDLDISSTSGNGDDAVFLYKNGDHTVGTLVDIYGEIDQDGSSRDWKYEDSRAVRTNTVTQPNATWTASEWFIEAANVADMTPGTHPDGSTSNQPPVLAGIGNKTLTYSNDLQFTVTASDTVDDDVVTLWASNLPAGAVFATVSNAVSVTNLFTWNGASPTGVYSVTFYAGDKDGSDQETIAITVEPRGLGYGDLIVTEVMQNPTAAADAEGEWFEIYNRGDSTYDLEGWTLADASYTHVVSNGGPLQIEAKGFLVFGVNTNQATNGGAPVDYEYASLTLNNSGDSIVLRDDALREVACLDYEGSAPWPVPSGASMYLKSPDLDMNNGSNWATSASMWSGSAGDSGSPGTGNELDSDGDGILDTWELAYFVDLDVADETTDFDKDGFLDIEESLADTNPDDDTSSLNIGEVRPIDATDWTIRWPSQSGKMYRVLRGESLSSRLLPIATNIPATAPVNVITDTPPVDAEILYYQIGLEVE